MNVMGQLTMNWPEIIYAFNMLWTTIVSSFFVENTYENIYKFYHQVGTNTALLVEDITGFKPKDGYQYNPNENVYAEQWENQKLLFFNMSFFIIFDMSMLVYS